MANENSGITSEWIDLTDEIAEEFLTHNSVNRKVRPERVDDYAEKMDNDLWDVTGDPIRFDTNGDLIDGQHRLYAKLKSKIKSIRVLVIRGLKPEAFRSIDSGALRTAADVLYKSDYKNANTLAAAARWLIAYEPVMQGKNFYKNKTDNTTVLEYVKKHPLLPEVVNLSVCAYRCTYVSPPILIGITYQSGMQQTDRNDGIEYALSFWKPIVLAADLHIGTPQHTLYKRLIEANRDKFKARLSTEHRSALCVKAYNAWFNGDPMKVLKLNEGESFPLIEPVIRKRSKST